jgi:hypothetical protein
MNVINETASRLPVNTPFAKMRRTRPLTRAHVAARRNLFGLAVRAAAGYRTSRISSAIFVPESS